MNITRPWQVQPDYETISQFHLQNLQLFRKKSIPLQKKKKINIKNYARSESSFVNAELTNISYNHGSAFSIRWNFVFFFFGTYNYA